MRKENFEKDIVLKRRLTSFHHTLLQRAASSQA